MSGVARTPGGESGITRPKPEADELEARLDDVEEALARGGTQTSIYREYGERWDVTRSTVSSYMTRVRQRQRLRAEAFTPNAQERREQLRQICYAGIAEAFKAQRAVVVGDGEGESHVEMVPCPDLNAVSRFVSELAKLDGLYNQPEQVIVPTVERTVLVLQEAYGVPPEALKGLREKIIDVTVNENDKG